MSTNVVFELDHYNCPCYWKPAQLS